LGQILVEGNIRKRYDVSGSNFISRCERQLYTLPNTGDRLQFGLPRTIGLLFFKFIRNDDLKVLTGKSADRERT